MSNHLSGKEVIANGTYIDISRSRLDLVVLRHMARKLHMALKLLDPPATTLQPLIYSSEERRSREHRIVIFNYQELLLNRSLTFVGFISGRREAIDATGASEITQTDDQFLTAFFKTPGCLCYSSLQLLNRISD